MRLTFIDIDKKVQFVEMGDVLQMNTTTIEDDIIEINLSLRETANCYVYLKAHKYLVNQSTLNGIYKKLEVIGV